MAKDSNSKRPLPRPPKGGKLLGRKMNRGKILVLMFLLYPTVFGNLYLQLKGSEDSFGTADEFQVLSSFIKDDSFLSGNSGDIMPTFSSKINSPTLKTWQESGFNSTEINRTLDLMIAQTLVDSFPLESLENLSSSEPAQNSLQVDVGNLSITLQDGAEDNSYSDFEETYSYDAFERTSLLPKDGSFSYNFSTNTGSSNFESKFKSYESLHDSDNVTFLMNLWNSSENNPPINPYSTPMNLSFDYNLIAEENLRTAPYHRLEIRLSFMEPNWKGGKSGSISIALLKHLFTPEDYDDPVLRVKTSSGINGQGYSYSEIYYNRSAVASGSGWHHFEANITDVLHRFLNTTANITAHYSVLDFIEVWAVSSVGDFNYTLLLDNFKLDYLPSAASVPLNLYWNGSATSLNNGTVSLDNVGAISSVSINSSVNELNPKLGGKTLVSLTRMRNESFSSVISFDNTSFGYFEANLTFPTLVATNKTYAVSSILPATWENLTIFMNESSFSAKVEGIIPSNNSYYPLAQLSWTSVGREGVLNGSIPNYLTQVSLPPEIQSDEWFFVNGTLLAPSDVKVKANITFGNISLSFETTPAIDGSFSLFIPPIDFGIYTVFELRVFWADQFQAGMWEKSVIVTSPDLYFEVHSPTSVPRFSKFAVNLTIRDSSSVILYDLPVTVRGDFGSYILQSVGDFYYGTTLPVSVLPGSYSVLAETEFNQKTFQKEIPVTVDNVAINLDFTENITTIQSGQYIQVNFQAELKHQNVSLPISDGYVTLYLNQTSLATLQLNTAQEANFSIYFPPTASEYIGKMRGELWIGGIVAAICERDIAVMAAAEIPKGELVNLTPIGIGPVKTNATVDLFYRVEYPKNGSLWFSNIPYDLITINISIVELWRGNELINVINKNQTFQWIIDSTSNNEDLLVVKVESPTLFVNRAQSEGQTTIECRLFSPLSLENVTLVLPLSSLEQTVENWTVLDYLNRNITSQVLMDYANGNLFVNSLSISSNSILVLRFAGKMKPMSISNLIIPTEVECGESVQISGILVSAFPFYGVIVYEIDNSSFSATIQTARIEGDSYNFFAIISSPAWNVTYHHTRLLLEDNFGNIIQSETFEIRSIDIRSPSVTVEYSQTSTMLNISILALDGPAESGIENVSVLVSSSSANWSFAVVKEEKMGWYSAVISKPSFKVANVTVTARDFAGNLGVVQDIISISPTELAGSKSSGIDLNPAVIGSVFLVTVLSGNQMIRFVKGRKVEL